MIRHAQLGGTRARLLLGTALLALCLEGALAAWRGALFGSGLEGRYSSSGQVQLSNRQVIDVSHSIRFGDGRFYAMTRQGDAILETSGSVEHGFWGGYHLRVEDGDVSGLSSDTDDELLFNLLYGRHKGSTIRLIPFRACLYGVETRQVYCAEKQHRAREPVEVSKRAAAKRQQPPAQSASLRGSSAVGATYSAPLAE